MKRVILTVEGEVQRVGYRDDVERIARKLKLTGYVENHRPYDVRIVAEGENEIIDRFIGLIQIKRFPIDVENVEILFEEVKGEFEYFEIRRGKWQDEIGERLDTAGRLLYRNIELSERSVELGEESVSIGKKMLNKQDSMLDKQDSMLDKQDSMLDKQDETIAEIKGVREDLKSYMERRFEYIEQEIADIKAKIGVV